MSTLGIAKRVFGMAHVERTQKANERQIVACADGGPKNPDGEQKGKELFSPLLFFLAMALQRFD
jgi:hypothetical protein